MILNFIKLPFDQTIIKFETFKIYKSFVRRKTLKIDK